MTAYNLVCKKPKFTQFVSWNAEFIVVDNAVYRLSIFLSSSEILAVKLENSRKSHRFLNVFCPQKF